MTKRRKPLNREEFEASVLSLQGTLYRLSCAYLKSEHDRLDAISEAVLKAWIKLDSLRNPASFRPFLLRILIRECVNIQRKQRRVVPMEIPEIGTSDQDPFEQQALRQAIDQLPEPLRVALMLHYMEGIEVKEIARLLGTTKGAVCSRLKRERDKLRTMLSQEEEI
jgi:RNA polymerase sigma-70 factor (ECF subfamily)